MPLSDSMILHHFEASPFSEKIRLVLGYKHLAWDSVLVPRILPKPDLMPLTGGYRRTPVLQIGRDIFADTRLIARVIDTQAPEPALVPEAIAASVIALETAGDQQLFPAAIPLLLSGPGKQALADKLGADGLAAFRADRAALFARGSLGAPDAELSAGLWEPLIAALDTQLSASSYLLGDRPCLADFALYHPVWYVRGNAGVADRVTRYTAVTAWADRMAAIGHGDRHDISAEDALAVARAADDFMALPTTVDTAAGLVDGQPVTVAASDYGTDPVAGTLVHADAERVTIERDAPGIGRVRNHFPRRGFRMSAADRAAAGGSGGVYADGGA